MSGEPCTFCRIVRGEARASVVHEDDGVLAFMDANPVNTGHVLVIPKLHAAHLSELPPELGCQVFKAGMGVAAAIRRSGVRCNAINLILADGREAGQEIFHVHLHVIPRFRGDNFSMSSRSRGRPTREELDGVASTIVSSCSE